MSDDLDQVAVLSDRLQAEGDLRGELLALELAAARASDVDESQRLNQEAQRMRARAPTLAWPGELRLWRGLIRAGMLIDGYWMGWPELPSAIGPHCRTLVVPIASHGLRLQALSEARSRAGVRLDALWEQAGNTSGPEMQESHTIAQPLELSALGLNRPLRAADGLSQLVGLRTLELGHRGVPHDLIAGLRALSLRGLGVRLEDGDHLRAVLDACPELEQLTLHEFEPALPGLPELARLRHLQLRDTRPEPPTQPRLADGLPLSQLDSLLISSPGIEDLERLADFQLRALTVLEPHGQLNQVVAKLAQLDSLERLTVIAVQRRSWQQAHVDVHLLGRLPRLMRLQLLGPFRGELVVRPGLAVYGSGLQLRGPVAELHSAFGPDLAQVDASQLRTLAVTANSDHPELYARCEDKLALVETLLLEDAPGQAALTWIRRLPRLRTLVTPRARIGRQQELAEQLPHVQIIGDEAARLRNEWLAPPGFDPLAVESWPKLG
jgi:hypothetical protein